MTPPIDRRSQLLANPSVIGIDYLYVDTATQAALDVHFIKEPSAAQQAALSANQVSITAAHGDAPGVPVASIEFPSVDSKVVLRVHTAIVGTFTRYTLRLADPDGQQLLDPYFASIEFSFKAGCYSDVDCDHGAHQCAAEPTVDFPVDYQARDFWSIRTALLDFASLRYPQWADRLEADAAVMLVEAMSALGDELSYHQDRLAREAYLETATQRRSIRRHARLVDYRIHDGLGAATWINVTAKAKGKIPAGTPLWTIRDGIRVDYSVGKNLDEIVEATKYEVDPLLNDTQLVPYAWDSGDLCLPAGTTALSLQGGTAVSDALKVDGQKLDSENGRWLLLRTQPANPAQPIRSQLVRVIEAQPVHDPLTNTDTTRIGWEPEQALPAEFDLTCLHVYGNIIPAIAGLHLTQTFVIGSDPDPSVAQAVERVGAGNSVQYLFSLDRTDTDQLVWRTDPTADGQTQGDPRTAAAELKLVEQIPQPGGGFQDGDAWKWKTNLLDAPSSLPLAKDFQTRRRDVAPSRGVPAPRR